MNPDSITTAIHKFVIDEVLTVRNLEPVGPDESLFDIGAVDSVVIARLVAFCEQRFAVAIPDHELVPAHFATVRAIARMIERLLNSAR